MLFQLGKGPQMGGKLEQIKEDGNLQEVGSGKIGTILQRGRRNLTLGRTEVN